VLIGSIFYRRSAASGSANVTERLGHPPVIRDEFPAGYFVASQTRFRKEETTESRVRRIRE
jgi:hypothetical protein